MTAPVDQPEYLTAKYLQRRWGISRAALWRNVALGRLPRPVHFGPRSVRWIRSEVDAFEKRLIEDRGRSNPGAGEGGTP